MRPIGACAARRLPIKKGRRHYDPRLQVQRHYDLLRGTHMLDGKVIGTACLRIGTKSSCSSHID